MGKFTSGKIPWNKGVKGKQVAWNKGLTKETDERIAKYYISKIGKRRPDMMGDNNPGFKKGKLHYGYGKPAWNTGLTKETNESIKQMALSFVGKPVWNKGITGYRTKPCSSFQKQILSVKKTGINNPMYGKSGEKSPTWKGGISKLPYSQDWTDNLKNIIRKRDKYICQICNLSQKELEEQLTVHHIDYDKENSNPDNLISLCRICHSRTNFNREKWEVILNSKTMEKEINYLRQWKEGRTVPASKRRADINTKINSRNLQL